MEKFSSDFSRFWELINTNINFAFARYADGEVMLMKGQAITDGTQASSIDKWKSPNRLTKVGEQLLETLNHVEDNYFYAISSITDNVNDYTFLKNNINQKEDNLTFVNLWINANYNLMVKNLCSNKREVILICNKDAKKENFPFNVIDITPFPNDCINFWEENDKSFIDEITKKYSSLNNQLFFISCGPISEIIIDVLYKANPNNTYVDVGSSIDEFVHGYKTRPYMDSNSYYSKLISKF
jgi:hypothetical protein